MSIQETVEKLRSIDVNELGAMIKNINWLQVKDSLTSKPHIIINTALIIGTIFLTIGTYTKYKRQTLSLKREIPALEFKLSTLKEKDQLQAKYDDFFKTLPQPISGDQLIDTVSDLAIKNNVQILSAPETQKNSNDFSELAVARLQISADNYTDIVNFIKEVETAPYLIRVASWSGSLGGSSSGSSGMRQRNASLDTENKKTLVDVEVESLNLKK